MWYERIDGVTHIHIEDDVDEMTACMCIVQASFVLARPYLESWKDYDPQTRYHVLLDESARKHVRVQRKGERFRVVDIDELAGRKCATILHWEEQRHFILDSRFEECRGLPDGLIDVANRFLEHGQSGGDWEEYGNYKGESLTLRLSTLRLPRKKERNGEWEDDWTYRKRVFPHLFARGERYERMAWEFLLGRSFLDWDDYDKRYHYFITFTTDPDEDRRTTHTPEVIVAVFGTDPMVMRKLREKQYKEDK